MERFQIIDTEIPLLEPPQKHNHSPRSILEVLFKHKLFITAVFLVVSLPVLIASLLRPTEYVATTKVLIKPSRAFLNLSPTSEGGALSVSPSPEVINSEIQIIRSREVLERLVEEVPLPNGGKADYKRNNVWRLKATPIRLSNFIEISLQGTHPEWLVRAVNRAAELYVEHHLKVHKTQGIEQFYEEQEKKLEVELTSAERALKDYQEREKIVDAGLELTSNLGRLAAFETTLRNTESGIRETNERIRILEAQLKDQPERVSSSKHVTISPVYVQIRDTITKLELERDSLLQRYTAKDRLVMDREKEIAELKARLKAVEQKEVGGESIALNSIRQGILNSLLGSRAELTALEARRSTLLRQVATYSSGAAELKKKSFAYDRLQQEVLARKEALALYKKRAEEARISEAMDKQKFGNVSIFEKATPPLDPAGRPFWMVILLTLIGSFATAVGGAFAIEFFNTALKNEADVEEQIGLPVLATIQDYQELTPIRH